MNQFRGKYSSNFMASSALQCIALYREGLIFNFSEIYHLLLSIVERLLLSKRKKKKNFGSEWASDWFCLSQLISLLWIKNPFHRQHFIRYIFCFILVLTKHLIPWYAYSVHIKICDSCILRWNLVVECSIII